MILIFSDYSDRYEADKRIKAVWNLNFRLYPETEKILDSIKDPDCSLFPLYRGIGSSESDYLFDTLADAEREYTAHIDEAIADQMYDL